MIREMIRILYSAASRALVIGWQRGVLASLTSLRSATSYDRGVTGTSQTIETFDADTGALDIDRVRCPRCGYDQRGVMNQWTTSCPLTGRCAECGLEFRWAELLVPEKFAPLWCVEYVRGGPFGIVRSCFGTLRRAHWPWGFWKRLSMSHDVRWRRICIFWIFLLLLIMSCYVVEQVAVALRVRSLVQQTTNQMTAVSQMQLQQLQQYIADLESMTFDDGEPSAWMYVGSTMTRIWTPKERDDALAASRARVPALQAIVGQTATIQLSLWKALMEAVFTPWKDASAGRITWPMFVTEPYPAPQRLHLSMMLQNSAAVFTVDPELVLKFVLLGLLVAAALTVLMPIEFVLLPVSRRRGKVRWRHVWRVAAYSVTWPAVIIAIALLSVGLIAVLPSWQDNVLSVLIWLAFAPALSIVLWWAVAIGRYMKIPRGWFIAPVFAVLAALVLVAAAYWGGLLTQDLLSR